MSAEFSKKYQRKLSLPLFPAHVVEHPLPHDEEIGDHHAGEKGGTEEHPGDQHLVLHADHARAGTVSARVTTVTTSP